MGGVRGVSAGGQARAQRTWGACAACVRRSWLLSALAGPLEYCARDRSRLRELLALGDADLLKALGGTRREELEGRYERFGRCAADQLARDPHMERICRHRRGYPRALDGRSAPHMLEVAGGARRLRALTAAPAVAIVGSAGASDYGFETARSLARGLAASGVTVLASLADGIAVAAHAGALDAGGASVAVMAGGLGVSCPARRRALYARVLERGCAVSELPLNCRGRRFGQVASERIVVELARLVVVVEADRTPGDLAGARIAQSLGRGLAAVPGRVSSPLSRGTHELLMEGAQLVRGAGDVLELLGPFPLRGRCGASCAPSPHSAARAPSPPAAARAPSPPAAARAPSPAAASCTRSPADANAGAPAGVPRTPNGLPPSLRATLERVGAGCDTPDRLTGAGEDPLGALLALSELEAMGLLVRGDGGRYLPRDG